MSENLAGPGKAKSKLETVFGAGGEMHVFYRIQSTDHDYAKQRFARHRAFRPDQVVRVDHVRSKAEALAFAILQTTPKSGEQSKAVRFVEEAVLWAQAAMERYEKDVLPPDPAEAVVVP